MKILNIKQLKKVVEGVDVNYNLVFEDGSVLDMTLGSLDDVNAEMILSKVPLNKGNANVCAFCESKIVRLNENVWCCTNCYKFQHAQR